MGQSFKTFCVWLVLFCGIGLRVPAVVIGSCFGEYMVVRYLNLLGSEMLPCDIDIAGLNKAALVISFDLFPDLD